MPDDLIRPDDDAPRAGNTPDNAREASLQISGIIHESRFQGPIPPPEHLERYEQILPGAAARIFAMAESHAAHAQELQRFRLEALVDDERAHRRERRRGQLCGLFVSSLLIVGGVTIALLTRGWVGVICGAMLSASGLASLVTAFIAGAKQERRENKSRQSNQLEFWDDDQPD